VDVNINSDWEAAEQSKRAVLEQSTAVFEIGRTLRQALAGHRRVFIYGRDHLALLAEYGARLFISGGVTGHGAVFPMIALKSRKELEAAGGQGQVLLWLNFGDIENPEAKAVVASRSLGTRVFTLGSDAGEFLENITDKQIMIPSRHQVVLTEVIISLLHSLYKIASETEETAIVPASESAPKKERRTREANTADMKFWGPSEPEQTNTPPVLIPPQIVKNTEVYNPIAKASSDPAPKRKTPSQTNRKPPVSAPTAAPQNGPTPDAKGRRSAAIKTLRFRCNSCKEVITVDRRYTGKKGQCPFCLDEFIIPTQKQEGKKEAVKDPRRPSHVQSALQGIADQAKRRERRRFHRFEIKDARALFKLKGNWYENGEHIADVSLTGVGVRLVNRRADEFELDSEIVMALDFPAFMEPLRVNGRLRRVAQSPKGVQLGFEFTDFKKDAEEKLQRLMKNVALRGIPRT
jgi:hypothetical protein